MILPHSFYYLLSALSLVAAQTPSNCGASVSLSSSMPGHGAFMYHDIIVENTGSCAITNVFAAITLPPYEEPFAYYNITSETGELLGLTYPMPVGKTEKGGTVVLRSMRVPIVAVGSVECEATCSGASPSSPLASSSSVLSSSPSSPPSASSPRASIPTTTIKVEVQWGANPRWVALSLFDELDTSEVWLIDASNTRQLMKRESWDSKTAYTFSANANPLALPLSLELKSYGGDIIVLKQFITSFAYTVLDTNVAFPSTTTIEPADYNLRLVAHPATTQNWVGLTPYGTQAAEVVSISIKGTNTDFIPMTSDSAGFFTLSSDVALRLPFSALLSFADGSSLTVDHVVVEL